MEKVDPHPPRERESRGAVRRQGRHCGRKPYDFCLPPQDAALSLLSEVRAGAPSLFAELRIPWHAGIDGGPSNHLLSSQVQCVNALGQMVELVLVEWKYTESYRIRSPDPKRDQVRFARYGAAFADPTGPVRDDLLAFEHILDEPSYQLVRQQLLAYALEQSRAEGAERVRVVHVLSGDNTAYQLSLARPEHRTLGATVSEVWKRLLRRPHRFVSLDIAHFVDPEITSPDYVHRYAAPLMD